MRKVLKPASLPEAWAGSRPGGYPALAPNPSPGANYAAASHIGGDNLATRVFWVKQ